MHSANKRPADASLRRAKRERDNLLRVVKEFRKTEGRRQRAEVVAGYFPLHFLIRETKIAMSSVVSVLSGLSFFEVMMFAASTISSQ